MVSGKPAVTAAGSAGELDAALDADMPGLGGGLLSEAESSLVQVEAELAAQPSQAELDRFESNKATAVAEMRAVRAGNEQDVKDWRQAAMGAYLDAGVPSRFAHYYVDDAIEDGQIDGGGVNPTFKVKGSGDDSTRAARESFTEGNADLMSRVKTFPTRSRQAQAQYSKVVSTFRPDRSDVLKERRHVIVGRVADAKARLAAGVPDSAQRSGLNEADLRQSSDGLNAWIRSSDDSGAVSYERLSGETTLTQSPAGMVRVLADNNGRAVCDRREYRGRSGTHSRRVDLVVDDQAGGKKVVGVTRLIETDSGG